MSKESLRTIEAIAKEFFEKLGLGSRIQVESTGEDSVLIRLTTDEPRMFIGEKGQTLGELQHLLKAIMRKKVEEPFYLNVDINDYKKNKETYIRELARTTADEVSLLKRPKELPPMTAAERRIVHMELDSREDVATESIGEGLERKVIVKVRE
ncbi:MAG: R3H domain-containing nucleic acid-binding protein [bacterium]|nr:R3H domain-containing nucleic acid-binding protein [bacterium]